MNDLIKTFRGLVSIISNQSTILFLEAETREIEVGIHEYEQGIKQSVKFDVIVVVGENNTLDTNSPDFLNYEFLKQSLDSVLENRRYELLENIANTLIEKLLEHNNIEAASVRISKLEIPGISGNLGCLVTKSK
tara:strand:+ start:204 stop:605 length:402 start_codon:yes stop_codon:yes gene_type:complete